MIIEFAPMEGITGFVFRRAHVALFSGVSDYYLPFIATHATRTLKTKEREDASPANNAGLSAVPQLLSKNADDCLWYLDALRQMGYRRVNLNLGCPSPTVTAKGKGAAMLGDAEGLRRFLDGIFSKEPGIRISVKTRLGIEDPSEIFGLLSVYNRFPLDELIVHGRTLSEAYRGAGHPELLPEILGQCKAPLCYNGNIFLPDDAERLRELCPGLERIMIGRGLIRNPALAREILGRMEASGKTTPAVRGGYGRIPEGGGSPGRILEVPGGYGRIPEGGGSGRSREAGAASPALSAAELSGSCIISTSGSAASPALSAVELSRFLDAVYQGYRETLPGPVPVLGRMKELWYYTEDLFRTPEPGTSAFRALRGLKKARTFRDYETAKAAFFACPPEMEEGTPWKKNAALTGGWAKA